MELFIKKMITEKDDLIGKIKKAENAITNNPFNMDKEERDLLKEQIPYMKSYLAILQSRIDYNIERK